MFKNARPDIQSKVITVPYFSSLRSVYVFQFQYIICGQWFEFKNIFN